VPIGHRVERRRIGSAFGRRSGVVPARRWPERSAAHDGRTMDTGGASQTGTHLDEHHVPETNGRMSVCRRCGAQTDGPGGLHHRPTERELARSNEWLIAQLRISHIDRARRMRGG
jgi:hypothetical protein